MKKDYVLNFLDLSVRFAESFKSIRTKYETYSKLVEKYDKATQDILHKMELDNLSQSDKLKFATKLAHIRRDRRFFKDKVEALADLMAKFDGYGQSFVGNINKMGAIAGNSRKSYTNRLNRKYTPRVITDLVIDSQQG